MSWIFLICCLVAQALIIRYVINNEDNIQKSQRALRINKFKLRREKRQKRYEEFLKEQEDERTKEK